MYICKILITGETCAEKTLLINETKRLFSSKYSIKNSIILRKN